MLFKKVLPWVAQRLNVVRSDEQTFVGGALSSHGASVGSFLIPDGFLSSIDLALTSHTLCTVCNKNHQLGKPRGS